MPGLTRFRSRTFAVLLLIIFLLYNSRPDGFLRNLFSTRTSERRPNTKEHIDTTAETVPFLDEKLYWKPNSVPQTRIVAHAPGWTILDRLYVMGGTIYIVTNNPDLIPPPKEIMSKGQEIQHDNANIHQLEPTEQDVRIVSTVEASQLFGTHAIKIKGVTFLVNECSQYLRHLYHFAAELLFGLWRTYSYLDPAIEPNGRTVLPSPRRIVFPHVTYTLWRDYASLNQFVLRAVFPSITMEFEDTWKERAALRKRVYVYDRVVFSDRVAAMHGKQYQVNQRIAAEAFNLKGSGYWWNTIRMAVLEYSKVRRSDIPDDKNVITYVSRQQWGRRMLRQDDHFRLVARLEKLRQSHGYEVNIVDFDKMTRNEQIRLAARTTVMMGVHGNGLTHLVWMKPAIKSTVIEFFYPGGYAHDYNFPAQVLGISHFGVWDNHVFTAPNLPRPAYPEGFQGNHIPLDADTVINLILRRMAAADADADD